MEIRYQSGLVLSVKPDNELYEKFVELDVAGNDDGAVDAEDFDGDEDALIDATGDVFFSTSPEEETIQEMGFKGFVQLYGKVVQFKEFTDYLKKNNLSSWGNELELGKKTWPEVKSQMGFKGLFTPHGISDMAYQIRQIFRELEGNDNPANPVINNEPWRTCGDNEVIGFSYNETAVPDFLVGAMWDVAKMYLGGANFLRGYNEVECDEDGWDSDDMEIGIGEVEYLKEIGVRGSRDIRTYPCSEDPVPFLP